jgi:LysM repeat protein
VRKGDTLSKIATRHGTTVKKLCQLNGFKSNKVLKVGQRIRVK